MSDEDDSMHYPNAGGEFHSGVSRRGLLAGSAAAGAAAAAGCVGDDSGGEPAAGATVFVFNTGDSTVSVVDTGSDSVVDTFEIGVTASFPSNQFSPGLTDGGDRPLWLNVGNGVRALAAGTLARVARVETGSGANWLEQTPDGEHLIVSAREPVHRQLRLDADPDSETFGEVTGELDRSSEGGRGDNDGPGPCDVTIHPDGGYAYVPDLYGDTLTVIDIEAFEVETQVEVAPVGNAPAAPWMGTAAWDGRRLLVEHDEGAAGSESIWDVSDPAAPEELGRLTSEDGLGERPLTSEIGPDSEIGYVFTPGTADVTVVDLIEGAVLERIDLGGEAFVGSWDPDREKLYVPVQTEDEVAVIDHGERSVATRISVGSEPYGATAATVRPTGESVNRSASITALANELDGDPGTTYCIGRCGCGHRL